MNKHIHRVIFSKARGIFIVASEFDTSDNHVSSRSGRSGEAGKSSVVHACFDFHPNPIARAVRLLTGVMIFIPLMQPYLLWAQIVADAGAPAGQRPAIIEAANGVPLINIQTPSAAGVSRNAYSQFDVQQQGAILNNARNAAQTQLGGWVQANPWLAGSSACHSQ